MAQKKISGMTAASSCTGAELIEVVQSSTSKQATLNDQVKAYFDTLYSPITPPRFTSSAQTITSGGGLTIAHGLGVRPFYVSAYIECTTADQGYSIGDRLYHPFSVSDASADGRGVSLSVNGTANVDVRFGNQASVFLANNKTTGAAVLLTNSSWRLYVIAEA